MSQPANAFNQFELYGELEPNPSLFSTAFKKTPGSTLTKKLKMLPTTSQPDAAHFEKPSMTAAWKPDYSSYFPLPKPFWFPQYCRDAATGQVLKRSCLRVQN